MSTMRSEERIGEAWRLHREGNHQQAIEQFEEILSRTTDNVDAHYGLGLAQRANGDTEKAKATFKKTLELSEKALDAVRTTATAEGVHGANDLDSTADDRFMMLNRMIKQRIEELES